MRPPRVLTFTDYYLPGYRGGGGIRTLSNMVDRLGTELEFRLVTRDRDLGEAEPYPFPRDAWVPVNGAQVRYLGPEAGPGLVRRILHAAAPDVLYLNSFFSQPFTLYPLLAATLARTGVPVVLAPRGELSPGALALKRWKKLPYLAAVRTVRLFEGLLWQVSSPREAADVHRWFGRGARVCVAPDLCGPTPPDPGPPPPKEPGELRIVFLSRISRKKNLDGALRSVGRLRGRVHLTIFGPVHEPGYWAECRRLIQRLPANVSVAAPGPVPPERVHAVLREGHVFLLPTHGENYGHAIHEAMLAGLPVVISDQTPWCGLAERGVGVDLPLADREGFVSALQQYVDMDAAELAAASRRAREFAVAHGEDPALLELNRELFQRALRGV